MSLSLELEIKTLLQAHGEPPRVADELIKLFESPGWEWSPETLQEFYRFLWSCGLYQQLISFCFKNINRVGFEIPWSYFIEALVKGVPELDEATRKLVITGIENDKAQEQVALARGAEHFIQEVPQWKAELRRKRARELSLLKEQALDELLTLRTQQLYEQEKLALAKLQRIFPGDPKILAEIRNHKERYALDLLSRKIPMQRGSTLKEPPTDPAVVTSNQALRHSLLEHAGLHPDMVFDFSVLAFTLDDFETSLELIEKITPLTPAQLWFKLEVMLRARHFLELLESLNGVEVRLASDAETLFATAYLRAQAYWGLGQKHLAIEILENLIEARPNYRSGSTLLDLWRSN